MYEIMTAFFGFVLGIVISLNVILTTDVISIIISKDTFDDANKKCQELVNEDLKNIEAYFDKDILYTENAKIIAYKNKDQTKWTRFEVIK